MKSVAGRSQPEFIVKQLFRVIQGHSFGYHKKAVEWLHILYIGLCILDILCKVSEHIASNKR